MSSKHQLDQAETTWIKLYDLIKKIARNGDYDEVERIMDADEKGAKNHAVHDFLHRTFPWLLGRRILLNQLANLGPIAKAELVNLRLSVEGLFVNGVSAQDLVLQKIFLSGSAGAVENAIAAGFSPQSVLRLKSLPVEGLSLKNLSVENLLMREGLENAWKALLPHWTTEDVMQSELLELVMDHIFGGRLLQLFEELGMDFSAACHSEAASKCMQCALIHRDMSAIEFLVNHGINLNACYESKPILHHLFDMYSQGIRGAHNVILDVFQRGANGLQKDLEKVESSETTQILPIDSSVLLRAVINDHAGIVEVLIAAGCSPQAVLDHSDGEFSRNYNFRDHKEVWKVLSRHWTAESVLQSSLLTLGIKSEKGGAMMQVLEEVGMDLNPCISSSNEAVVKCMHHALDCDNNDWNWLDTGAIRFLINHEFDVNSCFDSQPLLNQFLDKYKDCFPVMHGIILDALKQNANPQLKDEFNAHRSAIDISIDNYRQTSSRVRFGCEKLLNLFIRMGFRIPCAKLQSLPPGRGMLKDALIENNSLLSLQGLCRKEIRLVTGIKIEKFLDQLEYPQILKDFILLKEIDFKEFELDDDLSWNSSDEDDDDLDDDDVDHGYMCQCDDDVDFDYMCQCDSPLITSH